MTTSARAFPVAVALVAGAAATGFTANEQANCHRELRLARATAERIEREWPLRPDDAVTGFVRRVGRRLAQAAPPVPQPWTFTVVRDRSANAFAIGGGHVYLHDGTIAAAQNEAEVAAVLAHEMGHQLAGHFCVPATGDVRASEFLADLFRSRSSARRVGSLRQEIDPARESEADLLSVPILQAAGYDPRAALDIARRSACGGLGHRRAPEELARVLHDARPAGALDLDRRAFEAVKRQVASE